MPSLREMLERISAPSEADPAIEDDGGLFPADPDAPVVLVRAFGIGPENIEGALDEAAVGFPPSARLVCLTDQPDFLPLRRRGVAFEYLPPPGERTGYADAKRWSDYLTERHDIILAKWRPDRVVDAGTSLEAFLAGPAKP